MKLLVVDSDEARRASLTDRLRHGQAVEIRVCDDTSDALALVPAFQPDVILLSCETPTREPIADLRRAAEDSPRPIVMFAGAVSPAQAVDALRAGVAVYAMVDFNSAQLHSILAFASAHARVMYDMKRDLAQVRADLAARKVIERAKGLLMKRRNLDEAAAYGVLRKAAMDQGKPMAKVAQQLLEAEALLGDTS